MLATMTLHLAEPLVVRSITSREFGRLLHLRVVGQNSILISLPAGVPSDTELELTVVYGGRLASQTVDREAISVQQGSAQVQHEEVTIPLEAHFVYSNRSYWYPQATVTDYATAVLTIVVPAEFDAVASGTPRGEPTFVDPLTPGQRPAKQYVFDTDAARAVSRVRHQPLPRARRDAAQSAVGTSKTRPAGGRRVPIAGRWR